MLVYVLQSNFNFNLFQVFIAFFREMIGDLGDYDEIYEEADYHWVVYFFFFTSTLLLTISMLNLLIAIISDTFSRVKNAENLTKVWEKWNIITEIDEMLSKKNKNKNSEPKEKSFLLDIYNNCHSKEETTEISELKKSMEKFIEVSIANSIKANFNSNQTFFKAIENNFSKIEEFKANTEKSVSKNFEEIDKNSLKLQNIEVNVEKIMNSLKTLTIKNSNKTEYH